MVYKDSVYCCYYISNSFACLLRYFSHVQLFATLWTIARQAPLSMGFSRQEYWSGVPLPRRFKYDLNQIPYDYIVEVTNRFKGLDLIECRKNDGWRFMTLYMYLYMYKTIPKKRNAKRQNDCLRRPYK